MKLEPLFCNVCDRRIVNPRVPGTGRFYRVSGPGVEGEMIGDDVTIVFAICRECKLLDTIEQVS